MDCGEAVNKVVSSGGGGFDVGAGGPIVLLCGGRFNCGTGVNRGYACGGVEVCGVVEGPNMCKVGCSKLK